MQKWLIYELRKYIRNLYNIHPNSGFDYYSAFMGFAIQSRDDHGLGDWYNNIHPNLDSLSLSDAHAQSKEWHEAMASGGAGKVYMTRDIKFGPKWVKDDLEEGGYSGWTIQEVDTENDLSVEGHLMNHCVGSYWNDHEECVIGSNGGNNRIFSLRDPQNKPHVTIETDQTRELALQILGHSNSTPKKEYKEMIKFWVDSGESLLKSMSKDTDDLYYATRPTTYVSIDQYDTEVNEFLHNSDEYGLKPGETYQEIIDSILENGLKQLELHNKNGQHFDFCLSDTLTDYVVGEGDEVIVYYIGKLSEYSDAAWENFIDQGHEMSSSPDREDFGTDEDYDSAVEVYEEEESDLLRNHLQTAWNDCLHTDLINKFKKVRGEELWEWHKKLQEEKERKKRYDEGSFNQSMKNSKPIDKDRIKNFPNVVF